MMAEIAKCVVASTWSADGAQQQPINFKTCDAKSAQNRKSGAWLLKITDLPASCRHLHVKACSARHVAPLSSCPGQACRSADRSNNCSWSEEAEGRERGYSKSRRQPTAATTTCPETHWRRTLAQLEPESTTNGPRIVRLGWCRCGVGICICRCPFWGLIWFLRTSELLEFWVLWLDWA